jgi:DNA invertase Pin-like site-specific DNA recombinase
VLIVTRLDRLARSTRDLLDVIAALADFAAGALSETSGIAMPRAKKHSKLFHNRLDCLNEDEIKQLTTREIFAYFKTSITSILEPMFVEWWNARSE